MELGTTYKAFVGTRKYENVGEFHDKPIGTLMIPGNLIEAKVNLQVRLVMLNR